MIRAMTACMNCGSLELRGISNTEGPVGWGQENAIWQCRRCPWQGVPVEFESEQDWRAFVAALRGWEQTTAGEPPGTGP